MKFLKSLFFKMKAGLTLKTYQKPLAVTLITMLTINVIVLVIGANIALLIDGLFYEKSFFEGSFIEAFVGCVKWMISPNSLTTLSVRESWRMLILAIVIVAIGMVLFSGAIIATVTTALRSFIDSKSKAKGKILVDDHFVILNWNAKVPDMIYNLMIKGFKSNIVILSNQSKEYIESEIKSLLLTNEVDKKYKVKLIVKEGDPLLRSNLEDISIERASQICVMARNDVNDVDDDDVLNGDLLNLKIVLRLGSFDIKPDCQIVVETDSDEMRGQIENLSFTVSTLKKLSIIPVSFNRKIGQVIAQSLVIPQMSLIYAHLFSFEGAEFHSIDSDETIDSYMRRHNAAIPVYKDKKLFVLAENEAEIPLKREKEYAHDRKLIPLNAKESLGATVFVIGNNSKSPFIFENLEKSQEHGDISFELKRFEKAENARLIEEISATKGQKIVLILSDDSVQPESYDANVFVTLIELSKSFPNREGITFITELLDSRNLSSIHDFNIKNTIISNKMMSLLLTQLCLNKDSKVFFDHILTTANGNKANDFDLVLSTAGSLIEMEGDLTFETKADLLRTFYNTFDGKKILLGLSNEEGMRFFHREQDKKEMITIKPTDAFIYFKYID
ncbi:MAG: hypothetical protein K6F32_01795 [Bacilli bacterium]|nr:hypothetical protein [Bacilli bacterium]